MSAVTPARSELRRRLRQTKGRGRKLRGLAVLLSPYRWRVAAMFTSLVVATGGRAGPRAAGQARHR